MPVSVKKKPCRGHKSGKAVAKEIIKSLPARLPLPTVLYMELFCNPKASRNVGNGQRCFKFIACDGRTLYATTIMGEDVYLLVEGLILVRVHGCDFRVSDSGYLEIRTRGSLEYTALCPWTFRDASIPLIASENLVEFRMRSRRRKRGAEKSETSELLDDDDLDFGL